jgi:hypothetical protein
MLLAQDKGGFALMWLGLKNEIKFWFIRTFITRNCWMPNGDTEFSWANDDDIPQWVKDTDKSQWEFKIGVEEDEHDK